MSENSELYSTVDRLSAEANTRFAAVTNGSFILTAVIVLSGVLSAIFFWRYSELVFAEVWPPLALALGLAVGLMPAEGAFFGWKRIRGSKPDMTAQQLKASRIGLWVAVASSVFSTFAYLVISLPMVPEELTMYAAWLVFIALAIPLISQVIIFSWFAVNERQVVENYGRAELGAMGFDAFQKSEKARIMAIIKGQEAALNEQLEEYGKVRGREEAGRLLQHGQQELLSVGNRAAVSSNGHGETGNPTQRR